MADREYKLIADLVAENEKEYKYDLDCDSFELIMTDHNTSVENFHVYYKAEDTTLDAMTLFVKAFRERYCTRQSNVSLYNVNNIWEFMLWFLSPML